MTPLTASSKIIEQYANLFRLLVMFRMDKVLAILILFSKDCCHLKFLVSAIICRHVLAYTRPLTIALQAKDCDLYKAHKMAQRLVEALVNERTTEKFSNLWQIITRISSDLEIEPVKKRTVRKQSVR